MIFHFKNSKNTTESLPKMQPASPCLNNCSNLSLGFRAGAVSSSTPGTKISKHGEFVVLFMSCQELRKRKTAAANALKDLQLIFTKLNREADSNKMSSSNGVFQGKGRHCQKDHWASATRGYFERQRYPKRSSHPSRLCRCPSPHPARWLSRLANFVPNFVPSLLQLRWLR